MGQGTSASDSKPDDDEKKTAPTSVDSNGRGDRETHEAKQQTTPAQDDRQKEYQDRQQRQIDERRHLLRTEFALWLTTEALVPAAKYLFRRFTASKASNNTSNTTGAPNAPNASGASSASSAPSAPSAPTVPNAPVARQRTPGVPSAPAPSLVVPEKKECAVCYDRAPDTALVPCGHAQFCSACSAQLNVCPLCNVPIQRTMRIFTS
jgi:hypothetical protein